MNEHEDLDPVGTASVYKDRQTGELVVDAESVVAGDDEDDEDDDTEERYVAGEDEDDERDFPDVAGRRRKNKRPGRGWFRRKKNRRRPKQARRKPVQRKPWGMTIVAGEETVEEPGMVSVQIRLQHHFVAQDLTFVGSAEGAMVHSVFFADRVVWSNPVAIDVSLFNQNSQLRNLLGGQELHPGLDITVNGHMTQKGRFCAILTGLKPL